MSPKYVSANNSKHLIDIIFILSLFALFTISAVLLIFFGSDIYQKTVSQMDINYSNRTSIAYITEKIHQTNSQTDIKITDNNGTSTLELIQDINGTEYSTSLYSYDGYLYELFARTSIDLSLDSGQQVMPLNNLKFEFVNDKLIKISFTQEYLSQDMPNKDSNLTTIYVSLY